MPARDWLTSLVHSPAYAQGRGLTVAADMSGGTIEAGKLTANGHPMLMLTLRQTGVEVEMRLAPAEAADFADELQEVLDWLKAGGPR